MATNKLTDKGIRAAKPGKHGDGGGLWLQVSSAKHRSWIFRYTFAGKARDMGLGSVQDVTLAKAREMAVEMRKLAKSGTDPIEDRKNAGRAAKVALEGAVTFEKAAADYIAAHERDWSNVKHAAQWASTLATYAYPTIGKLPVADVTTDHILAILKPLWEAEKVETGTRVRGRIEIILNYAVHKGWRPEGPNPARWKGHLSFSLARPSKVRKVVHHAALPWKDAPAFMKALAERDGFGALALRFVILTAARSGEVRGATWNEINGDAWTIPKARMKARQEHRVPLTADALAVLEDARALATMAGIKGDLVFPGSISGRPLSDMSISAVLKRMERGDLTTHGFRSTFRDWCGETGKPDDLAEAALAHTVRTKTQAAYQRGDLLERRRELMKDWAGFLAG